MLGFFSQPHSVQSGKQKTNFRSLSKYDTTGMIKLSLRDFQNLLLNKLSKNTKLSEYLSYCPFTNYTFIDNSLTIDEISSHFTMSSFPLAYHLELCPKTEAKIVIPKRVYQHFVDT